MITWRARTYKPCEAILLAAYMTDRDKSGTRRSPDPKRAGCSRHPRAGPSTAPGASGDDATRHAHDGTTTRPNSRQRQHDPDDLPGRSQTRTVVPGRPRPTVDAHHLRRGRDRRRARRAGGPRSWLARRGATPALPPAQLRHDHQYVKHTRPCEDLPLPHPPPPGVARGPRPPPTPPA